MYYLYKCRCSAAEDRTIGISALENRHPRSRPQVVRTSSRLPAVATAVGERASCTCLTKPAKQSTATPVIEATPTLVTEATQESKTTPKSGRIQMLSKPRGVVWYDGGEDAPKEAA
jgi:hypothetical protein